MTYNINHADIKEWAANYEGEPFDAILCDPPYELGFMGKSWDNSGIAFDKDMWADILKLLKPGGHLLAFSGSRTYHRMAVAIEDAGFEIRDMIEWVYGSGFPKSLNIGKAVDKIQGNERKVVGTSLQGTKDNGVTTIAISKGGYGYKEGIIDITKGTSEWEGYGTALKPAHEPCVLARKPLEKGMTVATNALKHGTGGLNIDGSRVKSGETTKSEGHFRKGNVIGDERTSVAAGQFGDGAWVAGTDLSQGRFPANLIHDGSDEVEAVFPNSKSTIDRNPINRGTSKSWYTGDHVDRVQRGDSGSASRFFYTSKASKSERNAGLDGFEAVNVLGYEFDPENPYKSGKMNNSNIHQLTIARTGKPPQPQKNHHPTVKPLSLTKYLATLIKPPTGGRLLVPFSGSGSEMIGALQAGWEYVEGVELTEEYIPIAEARIKYWLEQKDKQMRLI